MTKKNVPALRADKRIKTEKDYWSKTITAGDASIYAYERKDRGRTIWVKYRPLLAAGVTGPRETVHRVLPPGGRRIRANNGALDQASVKALTGLLNQAAARLSLGEADPFAAQLPTTTGELTIRGGFALALADERGKFATDTRWKDEVRRAQERIEKILGADTPWTRIGTAEVTHVWRTLVNQYKRANPRTRSGGSRQAEITVDALLSTGAWLEKRKFLEPKTVQRPTEWRKELREEWLEITGESAVKSPDELPRHTEAEMCAIFAALGDPRRRLFHALRDSLPEAALAAVTRAGVEVDDANQPVALTVRWLRGRRTKGTPRAAWVKTEATQRHTLSAHQRQVLSESLSGHLRELETACRRGDIADYPLFPEGRLVAGRIAIGDMRGALGLDKPSALADSAILTKKANFFGRQQ